MWESHKCFLDSAGPSPRPELSGPTNSGEALHCSHEQWRRDGCRRTIIRRSKRRRRVGKGWPNGDVGGSSSKRGGRALWSCFTDWRFFLFHSVCFSSSSSSSFFSFLCSLSLLLLLLLVFFLFLSFLFCYFFSVLSSLFIYVFLYSLLSVSSFFSFCFSPLKLPKSVVSIPRLPYFSPLL